MSKEHERRQAGEAIGPPPPGSPVGGRDESGAGPAPEADEGADAGSAVTPDAGSDPAADVPPAVPFVAPAVTPTAAAASALLPTGARSSRSVGHHHPSPRRTGSSGGRVTIFPLSPRDPLAKPAAAAEYALAAATKAAEASGGSEDKVWSMRTFTSDLLWLVMSRLFLTYCL